MMMLLCVSAGDTVGDHGVRPGVEGDNDDVIVFVCQQVILSGTMALDPVWRETPDARPVVLNATEMCAAKNATTHRKCARIA